VLSGDFAAELRHELGAMFRRYLKFSQVRAAAREQGAGIHQTVGRP